MLSAQTFVTDDRQALSVWEWPQQPGRPHLHWAHATGFHGRMYAPLLDRLSEFVNVTAWDMRGHGTSRDAGIAASFQGWTTYYNDLKGYIAGRPEPIWLAGHSIGATTSLTAACLAPQQVAGLVLVEPVLLDVPARAVLWAAWAMGRTRRIPHARAAARRRDRFPSRQAAWDSYRAKSGFRNWPDEWLTAYVKHGLLETGDGNVELACRPEWESLSFAHTERRPWRYLPLLGSAVPVEVFAAEHQSTIPDGARVTLKRSLPQACIEQIEGTSHYLPMEWTDQLAARMIQRLSRDAV